MQLWTPDEVRGRVNAVNSVFIGASATSSVNSVPGRWRIADRAKCSDRRRDGAVVAVAIGGGATMAVAGIWSVLFPGLSEPGSAARSARKRRDNARRYELK